jgi:hypothetical protein
VVALIRTYYRDDQVRVTSTALWVRGSVFPLATMDRTWRRGGSVAGRAVLIGVGVVLAAGLFRAATSYAWWFGGLGGRIRRWATGGAVPLTLLAVGFLVGAVLSIYAVEAALLGVEHIREHGRHHELWASIRGTEVLLLRTSDAARFERVCRALVRARADRRAGGAGDGGAGGGGAGGGDGGAGGGQPGGRA